METPAVLAERCCAGRASRHWRAWGQATNKAGMSLFINKMNENHLKRMQIGGLGGAEPGTKPDMSLAINKITGWHPLYRRSPCVFQTHGARGGIGSPDR